MPRPFERWRRRHYERLQLTVIGVPREAVVPQRACSLLAGREAHLVKDTACVTYEENTHVSGLIVTTNLYERPILLQHAHDLHPKVAAADINDVRHAYHPVPVVHPQEWCW